MVLPGLETLAAQEITQRLQADVKRIAPGVVVFRAPAIDKSILSLRTTEDVFLLAWGTDALTYRAEDLDRIRRWTDRDVNWDQMLRWHHAIRPKPKGKPTYRLVVQMTGQHGYRRVDARKALARGLAGKLPASWRHADADAAVEIWLTIHGTTAVCGLRLSDRTMRHRTYKFEHLPASLRPTLAAAMVRLAEVRPGHTVLDPMCGAGTILAEVLASSPPYRRCEDSFSPNAAGPQSGTAFPARSDGLGSPSYNIGGDLDRAALRAAGANLSRLSAVHLVRWDARRLPLADQAVDRLLCNLPFGKKIEKAEDIPRLLRRVLPEFDRVLKAGGKAVLLAGDPAPLNEAVSRLAWKQGKMFRVRILGYRANLFVFDKALASGKLSAHG